MRHRIVALVAGLWLLAAGAIGAITANRRITNNGKSWHPR